MQRGLLIKKAEDNINYQIKKINFLCAIRKQEQYNYIKEHLESKNRMELSDDDSAVINQIFSDAIINTMASLIDYYCVYTMLRMDVSDEKITKVQYKKITNDYLLSLCKKNKGITTIQSLKENFDRELINMKVDMKNININDYWACFFGSAAADILYGVGIVNDKKNIFSYDNKSGRILLNEKIEKHYYYMKFMFCNKYDCDGVKYNIYFELNNYLKHNSVPYIKAVLDDIDDEVRFYSYFEINNHERVFLKPSLLRNIVELDFEVLRDNLKNKLDSENKSNCELEELWGLDNVIRVDSKHGYEGKNKEYLHFFIDSVYFVKTRQSTLIDAAESLHSTLASLINNIKHGMELVFYK